MGGVVAGHDGQSFGPPVGEVLVHGPVGVDIEEAGDQILSPGVQVTGTLGGAHSGDDAVFKGEGALLEGAVQEQLGVADDHGRLHLRQAGGGHRLAHAAGFLVGQGGEELAGALRILVGQHPLGLLQN